jgi:hypothetical protein
MTGPSDHRSVSSDPAASPSVEMPRSTVWPIVVALGITMLGAGSATNLAISLIGAAIFLLGLAGWVQQLLPGRGHTHESWVDPAMRHREIVPSPGTVDQLRPGVVGYRFQLPESFHPISAGVKGGIVGGLLMPIPALAYGVLSDHGIWFPINLLAGIVLPQISGESALQLNRFQLSALVVAILVHATFSLTFGLLFGVIAPALPPTPGGPIIAAGVLMPFLWSGLCHGVMGIVNPSLQRHVNWFWFVISQIVYGVAMSIVVVRSQKVRVPPVGRGPVQPPASPEPTQAGGLS